MTSFRFTIGSDDGLDAVLWRHAGAARFAYNQGRRFVVDGLAERERVAEAARCEGATPREAEARASAIDVPWSGFDLINAFNAWKRSPAAGAAPGRPVGLVWRHEVCAQVFEEAAVDLGRGLDAYSKSKRGEHKGRRVGFPARKRKRRCRESFRLRNKIGKGGKATIRVGEDEPRTVTLPVIGAVRVLEDTRRLRRLLRPGADGTPRARVWFATVAPHRGRWVMTLNVEAPDLHQSMRHGQRHDGDHGGFVGVDRGLSAWVVAASADGIERHRRPAPKALAQALPKLRSANRRASRKQPHSNNRRKANDKLNRIHGRVADIRRHAAHQVTTGLVKTHDRLCVEDLAVVNMVRNRHLARSVADAAWGELARQLTYKTAWYGGEVVVASRWFPSSKTCSACGRVNHDLDLSQRIFRCDSAIEGCGLVIDRDLNAAVNLAAWAEAEHSSAAQAPDPQAGGRVTNACGGTGAGHRTRGGGTGPATPAGKKQEPLQRCPIGSLNRTPEKGADEQPHRLFDRL